MRLPSPTSIDPELGPIRRCPGCHEWWPDDDEFFTTRTYEAGQLAYANGRPYVRSKSGITRRCKACHAASVRRSKKRASLRTAEASRRMTAGYCSRAGCPIRVPAGRALCHGCAGRVVGPLTPERIQSLVGVMPKVAA